jgi:protein TonB
VPKKNKNDKGRVLAVINSFYIFLLSILINFSLFSSLVKISASNNVDTKKRPVPINFVKIIKKTHFKEPEVEALPEKEIVKKNPVKIETKKKKPIKKTARIVKEKMVVKSLPPPSPQTKKIVKKQAPKEVKEPAKQAGKTYAALQNKVVDESPKIPDKPAFDEALPNGANTPEPENTIEKKEALSITKEPAVEIKTASNKEADNDINGFVPIGKLTRIPVAKGEIAPSYPEKARRMNKEGTVHLEVSIDTNGLVMEARVIKSAGFGFDEAAYEAVTKARFEPAMVNEKSVPVKVLIPVKFELE